MEANTRELLLQQDAADRALKTTSLFSRMEGEHVGCGHPHRQRCHVVAAPLLRNRLLYLETAAKITMSI